MLSPSVSQDTPFPNVISVTSGDPAVQYALIPGHKCYAAGQDGSIWSNVRYPNWKRLYGTPSEGGHLTIKLVMPDGRHLTHWIHILCLQAWRGPCPEGMECRHLNGVPSDNHLTNIEWNTRRENTLDRKRHGNKNVFGEGHHHAIFTDEEVLSLRQRSSSGESMESISRSTGKSIFAVRKAVRGKTYSHLPGATPQRKSPMIVTNELVAYVREQAALGKRQCELSRELDVPSCWLSRIINRKFRNG